MYIINTYVDMLSAVIRRVFITETFSCKVSILIYNLIHVYRGSYMSAHDLSNYKRVWDK